MSGSGSKKQPTISMFFAPKNHGGTKKSTTDEWKNVKKDAKVAKVNICLLTGRKFW